MAAPAPALVQPVFLLNKSLPAVEEKDYSVAEICAAAERTAGFETVEGAQRIGGLWRLYAKDNEARIKLLVSGIILRGHYVQPREKNPFLVRDANGEDREIATTKLFVGNIPMSFSNEDISTAVKKLGVQLRSKLFDERGRDDHGKLTRWKTGRRFVFIAVPSQPLPKEVPIGPFRGTLYHKEQKTVTTCTNCLQKSHNSSACTAPVKCRACYQDGHKAGAEECQLSPHPPPPLSSAQTPAEPNPTTTSPTTSPPAKSGNTAKAKKQTTLPFDRRSRSHTPVRGKRTRSKSAPRSPSRANPKKNPRNASDNTANARAAQPTEKSDKGTESDSGNEDYHDT